MMNKIIYTLPVIAFLLLSSCEEVIEIDLNDSAPAFVVEAELYKDSLITVRLTQTANYFSVEEPVIIEGATVLLSDQAGESEELIYTGNGFYTGQSIRGTENSTYEIEILVDDKNYSGVSYLPFETEVYSMDYNALPPGQGPPGPVPYYFVTSSFKGTPGENSYFMLRYKHNGRLLNDRVHLLSGFFTSRDTVSYSNQFYLFNPLDTVEVIVYSIDEPLFNYFTQLNDAIGGGMGMSSTPYNPASNIQNGALGYFAAWSVTADTLYIPYQPPL